MTVEKAVDFNYIGIIRTPFTDLENMPIQPHGASGTQGTLILEPEFQEGLRDLDGFSHIYVIYHLHQAHPHRLTVTPFLDTSPHGLFATRAPSRPNPIGLSIVRLISIKNNLLTIENVDMLDGTPVLDIKPYVPFFDDQEDVRIGWLAGLKKQSRTVRTDGRFK